MKTNILIAIVAVAFLAVACGSSKTASTIVNDDALSVLTPKVNAPTPPKVETEEMEENEKAEEMEKVTSQPSEEMVMEEQATEMMAKKTEETASEAAELSTLEAETLEINEDKIIEETEVKAMQQDEMNMVGKYKWVKRICCGRMRVETTPQNGEELFMEMTADGQLIYSGNAQKKADNTTYEMKTNSQTFPDRSMLKIEGKVDAMVRFVGDTLVVDRGYIDLDKNYWIKVKE